ncbi:hypothetical protein HG536_0H02050 [Torulaspora globosa]|uniref:Protein IFH1 n=1 Tax=Torulaspora globosa TaxID=48254 RepID=A0A7G3ZMU4_9SACH|nr:uncharacterized protein HG536_0H02050 [Torulaspora globosa]QLL34830.1 hypothetical protein HG536_0H02050 [Torulaspora globosa]
MVAKTARKNVVSHGGKYRTGQKLPANASSVKRSKPGIAVRPRRFSLLYSSDSSLSDVSDLGDNRSRNEKSPTKRKMEKVRSISNNATGKRSKLIQDSTEDSSDGQAVESDSEEEEDGDDSSDDDDESDSDGSESDTSSDDESIDFVKLTAQRKKRAMKALSALKKNKSPTKSPAKSPAKSPVKATSGQRRRSSQLRDSKTQERQHNRKPEGDSDSSSNEKALAFNFKKDDDGIRYAEATQQSEEDIGEEVKDSNGPAPDLPFDDNLNQLHVPEFSVSEESEYDIDQDAYFNVIDDESMGEMDTGLDTGEDEMPILHEEEKILMAELQNADDLSLDGSIHEDGSDPDEKLRSPFVEGKPEVADEEDSDDDDEIMTVFDMPFYEDPKFASLYYCEDGDEPRLSLSTSLPLLVSGEKLKRMKKRKALKLARQERIQRRKLLKEKSKANGIKTSQIDGDEYIFGVFFQSDNENGDEATKRHSTLRGNLDLESPLRRLGSAAASDASSDDEYDNILLDVAHMPSDDEVRGNGHDSPKLRQTDQDSSSSMSDSSAIDLDDESDLIDYDRSDDDDYLSDTNVFIDIDDLDPDSFYFQDRDDENMSSFSEIMTDETDISHEENSKEEALETVKYFDDESTDEDDNLPPPNSRSKMIGSKAKEIVSANIVGLKPPKLGTWETDSKPFTIIDGLSTKSLYPLIQEHQQFIEQQQRAHSQSPDLRSGYELSSANGDELTLNELLNMSELEDEDHSTPSFMQAVSNWYEKPKVPLSAFRNKGINEHEDDEYMLPVNSTRKVPIGYIGSERTRRKIDRMKELQRKKTEKRRRTKKKKKLLKLKRRQERLEKERHRQGEQTIQAANTNLTLGTPDLNQQTDPESAAPLPRSRKSSVKSVGLEEIHEILGKDNSDLLDGGDPDCALIDGEHEIDLADADILASLTAPIQLDSIGGAPSWRRRQSMAEAAAENLRFTKNGLFSESALADIEDIIGTGVSSGAFEFSASLQ